MPRVDIPNTQAPKDSRAPINTMFGELYNFKQVDEAAAATPAAGDKIGFWDSVNSLIKSITWTNFLAQLSLIYSTPNGWFAADAMTYVGADAPTYTASVAGDKTGKYSAGMRLRVAQAVATLKAYYRFNTGALTTDDSGSSHTLTAIGGGGAEVTGKFGKAVSLAVASSQAYSATDHADFKPTGAFSIGVWMKTSTKVNVPFQSYSQNTNVAGILIQTDSNGNLNFLMGKNTGTTPNTDYKFLIDTTKDLSDGVWHFIVCTWDTATMRIFIDGKLRTSAAWANAPGYAATNYVRVGCLNQTGSNLSFSNGYFDDLFLLNGTALTEGETLNLYYQNSELGNTGSSVPILRNFILTAPPVFDGTNTILTMYGGTDFVLANATISSPFYSVQKAPQGFISDVNKWTIEVRDTASRTQASPTQNVWYNPGAVAISLPIGVWDVKYLVLTQGTSTSGVCDISVTLSTGNNTESDSDFRSEQYVAATGATGATIVFKMYIEKIITNLVKTTYYLNIQSQLTTMSNLYFRGDITPTMIRAICAYL